MDKEKITIFAAKSVIKNIMDGFSQSENIKLVEQKRESLFKTKFRAKVWMLKSDITTKWQSFIYFLKHRRSPGPLLGGGGGFDYETLYGFVANFLTIVSYGVASNAAWDLIKLTVTKSWKHLKNRHEYITIASTPRQPMDTLIRMEIPTDLDDQELDNCLNSAEKIYKNIDEIRYYFGYHKIIIRYADRWRWEVKFKGKY